MVFAKSAFSIMVHKIFDLGSIFGGQNGEISMKNRLQKHAVFQHRFFSVLFGFCSHFGVQQLVQNSYFSKKKRGSKASSEAVVLQNGFLEGF